MEKALQAADRMRDAPGAPMKIAPARSAVLGRQGRQAAVPLPAEVSLDGCAPQDVALAGVVPIALRQQPVVKGVEDRAEHGEGNMAAVGLGQEFAKHRILLCGKVYGESDGVTNVASSLPDSPA